MKQDRWIIGSAEYGKIAIKIPTYDTKEEAVRDFHQSLKKKEKQGKSKDLMKYSLTR